MARDPYNYFRIEARELLEGMSKGVLQMERGPVTPELAARLLRLAHTLKGAARVVRQPGIAEGAHKVEEILAEFREATAPLPEGRGSALLRLLDGMEAQVKALDLPKPPAAADAATEPRPPTEEPFDTIRVRIEELDTLLMGVGQAEVVLGALSRETSAAEGLLALAATTVREQTGGGTAGAGMTVAEQLQAGIERLLRSFTSALEQARAEVGGAREVADRLRLVPAQTVMPALERAVRDAAQALGKAVDFVSSGGDIRLDAAVLAALRDALLHVVRNAVAHGVEAEGPRRAAGKPERGRVRLEVRRRGTQVVFSCSDDGAGIDLPAVRRAAVQKGLVPAATAEALDARHAEQLLLAGGLSTADRLTEIAGRGVGLDVARETATRLGGSISLGSEPGRGTTVAITVPFSIASLEGLVVEAGGVVVTIPLRAIRQTIRVPDSEVLRRQGSDTIVFEDRVIPFLPLQHALLRSGPSGPPPRSGRRPWCTRGTGWRH